MATPDPASSWNSIMKHPSTKWLVEAYMAGHSSATRSDGTCWAAVRRLIFMAADRVVPRPSTHGTARPPCAEVPVNPLIGDQRRNGPETMEVRTLVIGALIWVGDGVGLS